MTKQPDAPNETPKNRFRRDLLLVLVGGCLALSGTVVSALLGDYYQERARDRERLQRHAATLSATQAEIEANILLLKAQFDIYHSSVLAGQIPEILQVRPANTVYQSMSSALGDVPDLALVAEIVAFYSSLQTLEGWSRDLRPQAAPDVSANYVSAFANLLGASLHLQARLAARTGERSRELSAPALSSDAARTFEAIKEIRLRLGRIPSSKPLTFHDRDNDEK